MSTEQSHEELLRQALEIAIRNNQQIRPGTPMAELKSAIETALNSLPPLEFEQFAEATGDTEAVHRLVDNAPELAGWDADRIVEWVQKLAEKM